MNKIKSKQTTCTVTDRNNSYPDTVTLQYVNDGKGETLTVATGGVTVRVDAGAVRSVME